MSKISEEWIYHYNLAQQVFTDNNSWEVLYNISYKKVYNYSKKLCFCFNLDAEDASDITSEAFSKCYAKIEHFRPISLFSSWVCGFALNIAYNYKSKKIRIIKKNQKLKTFLEYYIDSNNTNPEDIFLHKELYLRIWNAYDNLSLLHKAILNHKILKLTTKRQMISCIKKIYGNKIALHINYDMEEKKAIRILRIKFFSTNIYLQ